MKVKAMFNTPLLMASRRSTAAYTHLVRVERGIVSAGEYRFGFDYNSYGNNPQEYGYIDPSVLINPFSEELLLEALYCDVFTAGDLAACEISLKVQMFLTDYQTIHLGRSDTKQYFGNPSSGSETTGDAMWVSEIGNVLFTTDDVGKDIPIWLSYDPPPWI